MRYILDSEGYVCDVSLGADIMCDCGDCVEYTGKIPSGYSTIDEWVLEETPRLNAWKIVDGDLVFDEERAIELERIWAEQEELNRHVTYGEVQGMLNGLDIEASNQAELEGILPTRTEEGEVIYVNDSSSYPVERMLITSKGTITDTLNLYISTSNMLPNKVISGNKNGIAYTVNDDKGITLKGTVTEAFNLTVSGSEANTVPLFIFKAGQPYFINKVSDNVNLNLYANDGTDRTLVYTGIGDASVTFEEDVSITHAEISIASGSVNETVSLMVSVGEKAKKYETCYYTIVPINLYNNTFELDEVMTIEYGLVQIEETGVDIIDMPCTFYEKTIMYTDKGAFLEVDYKKSSFETVKKSGKGVLNLRNTADGYGSIFNLTIKDLEGGAIYTLETSDGDEESEQYMIDLTEYEGEVDIEIEEGNVSAIQDGVYIDIGTIYVRTYSPRTYIELLGCTNRMTCEYMIASDFSVYCTKVEKDASIQLLDDKISLEVKRASAMEGELSGRITVEADRIEQIVESVGSNGKVTPASIVAAINEDGSMILISADKVDMKGVVFPTIQNAAGDCQITTLFNNAFGDGIEYNSSAMHVFNGSVIFNPNLNMYGFMIRNTSGEEIFRTGDNFINIGKEDLSVRLRGNITVNGEPISGTTDNAQDHIHDDLYYTEAEIDEKLGDIETILNTLNGTGLVEEVHSHNERYYQEVEIDLMLADAENVLAQLNSGTGVWEIEEEVVE